MRRKASLSITVLCLLFGTAIGCRSTVREQTPLPRQWISKDDIQYFPAGPEFKLTNQVQALEEYKLEREKLRAD